MAKYKLHGEEGYVQNTETMGVIPDDPMNSDYQEYTKWLEEGNLPDPWKTTAELNAEKYAKEIDDDIEKDDKVKLKEKRDKSIQKLKQEGKLPQNYVDPWFPEE